jgi:hypothetical protein
MNDFFFKSRLPIIRHVLEGRFCILLVFMLVYLAVIPLLENFSGVKTLLDIFLTASMIAFTFAISPENHQRIIAAILAVPMFSTLWLNRLIENGFLTFTFHLFFVLFFAYSIAMLIRFVFKTDDITPDVIYASIVGYLFIGVLWAEFYNVFELLNPGSFRFTDVAVEKTPLDFTYYSFVTLTTLGYGDITPLTAKTKSFSMLEALIGQFYITILIARLVGLHIARKRNGD